MLNQGLELTLGSTWQLSGISGTTQLAAATNRSEAEDIRLGFPTNGLEKG